jgi:hypothetical protein
MTATYDLSTDTGKVRLLIPDTSIAGGESGVLFTDQEIAGFLLLEGDSVRRATALALETLASNQALVLKVIKIQDLQTDGSKVAESLMSRAQKLREQANVDEEGDDAGSRSPNGRWISTASWSALATRSCAVGIRGAIVHPDLLAQVRAVSDAALPSSCAIRRNTPTDNGQGGASASWNTVEGYESVPCRYAPNTKVPLETVTPIGVRAISVWDVTFSATLPVDAIRASDRLVIDGRTFQVTGGGGASYEASRRVLAVEIAAR